MATQCERGVPTEQEPEYVGVHSDIAAATCQKRPGDSPERCGNDATHTMVLYSGAILEIAVCDECGEPDGLPDVEREWSGR